MSTLNYSEYLNNHLEQLSLKTQLITECIKENIGLQNSIIIGVIFVLYYFYIRKFKNYRYIQPDRFKKGKRILGNTLPSTINGWFWVCSSSDLPKGKTLYFDKNGNNLVFFRGEDGIVYGLDAYCSHMGANLADGTVTQGSCIACPFHNWIFNGKTGECLSGKNLKQAKNFKYEVTKNSEGNTVFEFVENDLSNNINKNKSIKNDGSIDNKQQRNKSKNNKVKIELEGMNGKEASSSGSSEENLTLELNDNHDKVGCSHNTSNPGIKNYVVFENAGIIYVFLHAIREKELKPDYYPFDLVESKKKFVYRGKATNITTNQFQDIPENGADIAHFLYIHPEIIPKILYGYWKPKWLPANHPNLYEEIKSDHDWITKFRTDLVKRHINKENESKVGIVLLENQISFFNSNKKMLFFGLIGFQVGPGLVYLYLKSPFFETLFFQYSEVKGRFDVEVHHEIWTHSWMPYWLSAVKLRLEAQQVTNDCKIWDNKKFGGEPWYNMSTEADAYLVEWRKYFCQFYEGCKEKDEMIFSQKTDW